MLRRITALLRAHLGAWRSIGLPVMTLAVHALVASVLCLLVGREVGPFAYAVFVFSLASALVAVPLVGELGFLLRSDEAADFVEALPARRVERVAAKALGVLLAVSGLATASLLPAAVFAPGFAIGARLLLVACGLATVWSAAAVLLALQGVLARVPALLVALEAVLVAAVFLGLIVTLPRFIALGDASGIEAAGAWMNWPPAWFAAPFGAEGVRLLELWRPAVALVCAAAAITLLPRPKLATTTGSSPLDTALRPIAALARRAWVSKDERAGFDFVLEAFPREREVAMRTAPLLGIPLAFLWVAFGMEPGGEKTSLVALILFTPGIYLPVILSHLPASASYEARWLLDGAPLAEDDASGRAFHEGARKAVAVRYLVPLALVLGLVAWQQIGLEFAARLALPAAAVSLLALRFLYRASVDGLPLTKPTEEAVRVDQLGGPLMVAGVGLAVLSLVAERTITTPLLGVAAAVALFVLDALLARAVRRLPVPTT
ncbi:MAG: hypothetical protein R3F34_05605 [Planctomycetota bacterium]